MATLREIEQRLKVARCPIAFSYLLFDRLMLMMMAVYSEHREDHKDNENRRKVE